MREGEEQDGFTHLVLGLEQELHNTRSDNHFLCLAGRANNADKGRYHLIKH